LPLPPFIHYYAHSIPQVSVRVDVTYLRQDFSMLQEVENADPWPKLQRFDFLVRSAYMNKTQAQAYSAKFKARTAGVPSPYQDAVQSALRSLTGLDLGTNAEAWRKVLPKGV
jgi:hypothetical protein